jgi:hypothetical protein
MDYQYNNPEGLKHNQRNEKFPHEREELSQIMFQRPFEELTYIEQIKLDNKQSELWLADWQNRWTTKLNSFDMENGFKQPSQNPQIIVNPFERKIQEWREKGHSEETIQTWIGVLSKQGDKAANELKTIEKVKANRVEKLSIRELELKVSRLPPGVEKAETLKQLFEAKTGKKLPE